MKAYNFLCALCGLAIAFNLAAGQPVRDINVVPTTPAANPTAPPAAQPVAAAVEMTEVPSPWTPPAMFSARDITSIVLQPSLLCHLEKTTTILGYQPYTGKPVYQQTCAGFCLSLKLKPTVCTPGYTKVSVTEFPSYGDTYGVANLVVKSQVTSCSCVAKGCDVTSDFGAVTHYAHGATVINSCDQKCTCSYGNLINCCRQRKDFRLGMTATERTRYINAVKTVSTNPLYSAQYASIVTSHQALFSSGIHGNPTFFPWHRYFILQLENLLQQVDCRVTVPYFSWNKEAASPMASTIWGTTGDKLGGNGDPVTKCVMTGPFAFPAWTITSGTCLKRNFNFGACASDADLALMMAAYPTASASDYNGFRSAIEAGVGTHNAVHCLVGGTMCTSAAAEAPEFFLHHCNIDRIWAKWQAQSAAHMTAYQGSPSSPMPGTTTTPADVFDLQSQPGGVRVCYIATPFLEWVDNVLVSLARQTVLDSKKSLLSTIRRPPVEITPDRWLAAMKMSTDDISRIRAMEAVRNDPTQTPIISNADLASIDDISKQLGMVLTDAFFDAAQLDLKPLSQDSCPAPADDTYGYSPFVTPSPSSFNDPMAPVDVVRSPTTQSP